MTVRVITTDSLRKAGGVSGSSIVVIGSGLCPDSDTTGVAFMKADGTTPVVTIGSSATAPPIKVSSTSLVGTPVNGAIEYNGAAFYVTVGGVRTQISGITNLPNPQIPPGDWTLAQTFMIDGEHVGYNVTAPNLTTLTDGAVLERNLHHHRMTNSVIADVVTGQAEIWPLSLVGLAYHAADSTHVLVNVDITQDLGADHTPYVIGLADDYYPTLPSDAVLRLAGEAHIHSGLWADTPPDYPDIGKPVWAAARGVAPHGKVSLTAPTTPGHYKTRVGFLKSVDGGGAGNIIIQIGEAVRL